MKKLLTVLLTVVFISTMSLLFVNAEDTLEGFEFTIDSVNDTLKGEDGIIVTNTETVATANLKWATYFICTKVEGNVYEVTVAGKAGDGTNPTITLAEGEIIIGLHSSTGDATQIDTYPNVLQKAAAAKVAAGIFIKLTGIDLDTATVTEGLATVYLTKPEADVVSETESSDEIVSTESTVDDDSTESVAATSVVAEDSSSDSKTSDVTTSENNGLETSTYILIGVAVVVVIGAIAFIVAKKKK